MAIAAMLVPVAASAQAGDRDGDGGAIGSSVDEGVGPASSTGSASSRRIPAGAPILLPTPTVAQVLAPACRSWDQAGVRYRGRRRCP